MAPNRPIGSRTRSRRFPLSGWVDLDHIGLPASALEDTKLDKSAELVAEKICETLTYYRYPQTHWTCIRTSDPLERNIREIRPHIRVVGAFPDGQSPLMPVAARLRYVAGTKCGTQRYFLSIDALGEYAKLSGN